MRIPLYLCIPALLLSSCAPSIPYATDYPLTQSFFRSRDNLFTGRVPVGWFSSTEDSLAPALTAWLIREDFSATLTIKELRLDRLTEQRIHDDGLKLLATLNGALERHTKQMREVWEYRMDGKLFCGYEFESPEAPGRVVVFSAKEKFYACTAQRVTGSWTREDFIMLFRAQQSVLGSLIF